MANINLVSGWDCRYGYQECDYCCDDGVAHHRKHNHTRFDTRSDSDYCLGRYRDQHRRVLWKPQIHLGTPHCRKHLPLYV